MNLTLTPMAKTDASCVRSLYQSAFPAHERRPYWFLARRAKKANGCARILVARDGGDFVGFAYLIERADLHYLFYFAIAPEKRGMGYGSAILRLLREEARGGILFLAREQLDENADNYAERVRRRAFYLRAGFEDLSCRMREASDVYDVMSMGGDVAPEAFRQLMEAWCGGPLRRFWHMELRTDAPQNKEKTG